MLKKIVSFAFLLIATGWATAQDGSVKIGVFDSQPVWQQTNEGKKMQARLADFQESKVTEINAKEAELNDLKRKLRDQEMNLSEEKKNQMLKEIDQKTIGLNRLKDDATREMKAQLGDAQDQFQRELFQVVEALGKEKNYSLILEKTIVVYSTSALDITNEVVVKFNEMFKADLPPAASTKQGGGSPANN